MHNNEIYNSRTEYFSESLYKDLISLSFQKTRASLSNYGKGYSHLPKLNIEYTI